MKSEYESKSVIDTLKSHVSIREFKDKKINDNLLFSILNAARRSPTSSNMQAYSLVVVRDKDKKEKLSVFAGNQKHIITCDTFVAVCADISRLEIACAMDNNKLGKGLENTLVSTVDASLVGMSLSLAAESVGLGTVMIGGMRNHPDKVAELLEFPKGVYVVFGMCIGWPDWENVKNQKPRMQEDLIIHRENYKSHGIEVKLIEHDKVLAEHYRSEGSNTPDKAWTGIISSRFTKPRRPYLRTLLENMGFKFD